MADAFRRMSNGLNIPTVGLRTYDRANEPLKAGDVEKAVKYAINAGYRHIDSAWINGNEQEIGDAIHNCIRKETIQREDIFVTTKVWNNFHEQTKVVEMLQESLMSLDLDYVDLYLMHWPMGFKENSAVLPVNEGQDAYSNVDYCETWKGMEECVRLGYTKSIGVANFNSQQIERLLKHAIYKPVVNQVEVNLYFNQKPLIQFCRERDILITGYCPFGQQEFMGPEKFAEIPVNRIENMRIYDIAAKHEKTPAQVVLNYLVSLGICVLPRSRSEDRMAEYLDIFDFTLGKEDIEFLDSCNKNHRMCPMKAYADHPYYPFKPCES